MMRTNRAAGCVGLWVVLGVWNAAPAVAQPAPSAPDREVKLLTGTEQTLHVDYAVGNTAIGNPGVCEIEVLPGRREVLLIARGLGITTLTLWDQRSRKQEEIRIEVSSRELNQLQRDLTALLVPYPGVRAEPLGSSVVLSGTVTSQEALMAVQRIAQAAGVSSVVTLGASLPLGGGMPVTGAPSGAPPPPAPGAAPPRPPAPMLPSDAALPVALTSGNPSAPKEAATPAAPITMSLGELADDGGPPPAAAVSPPPPNVFYVATDERGSSLGFGSGLTGGSRGGAPAPRPPTTGAAPLPGPAGAPVGDRVEYRLELYQQSALAPPPEVMGPQGTRIYGTTLTAYQGRPTRELLVADPGGPTPDGGTRGVSGLSIEVTPTIAGKRIVTQMIIDTNLPIGLRDTPGPHPWRRARLQFDLDAGGTRYVTEDELASLMGSAGSASPAFTAEGGGGPGAGRVIAAVGNAAAGVGMAAGVPEARAVPAISGLFRLGGGGGGRQAERDRDETPTDDRRLVIVVRPVLGAAR